MIFQNTQQLMQGLFMLYGKFKYFQGLFLIVKAFYETARNLSTFHGYASLGRGLKDSGVCIFNKISGL